MLRVLTKRFKNNQFGIVERLSNALTKKQQLLAGFLNVRVNTLNRKIVCACFAVYCFCFGAACLYIGIEAFTNKAKKVELVNGSKKKTGIEIANPTDDSDLRKH